MFASSNLEVDKGVTWWTPPEDHKDVSVIVVRYGPTGYQEDCVDGQKCVTFDHQIYKTVEGESVLLIFGESESLKGIPQKYHVVVDGFKPYYVVSIAVMDKWGNIGEFS